MISNRFLASVVIAVTLVASARATPFPAFSEHATHGTRQLGPDVALKTYHAESTYETFGQGEEHPLHKHAADNLQGAAVSYVASKLGIDESSIAWRSGFFGEAAHHAFVHQQLNGIPVANAVANVAFNNDDRVVAFGSSFVKEPKNIAPVNATVSIEDAISNAERLLHGSYNHHPATLEYFAKEDGSVALAHVMQIANDEAGTWFEAFIDAHSGELLSAIDFVAHATYRALPITKQLPTQGFELLVNPEDPASSPLGWHNDGTTNSVLTSGNNAAAFKNVGGKLLATPQSANGLVFDYPADFSQQPTVAVNIDAARVNAFYIVNTVHDISYRYGFTEAAFNFQNSNNGKGGTGGDPVLISVQDGSGTDNANFATPPDGQSGIMRMFLWDLTNPLRDGALENDIVVHEMTHGITTRLTGGGSARCLQSTEARGLGEGWSDAMAEWTEQTSGVIRDYVTGQFVTNKPLGIRTHPYSTNPSTNPLRYSSVRALNEVHNIGEVWANMLHQVYAALVTAKGFSADAPRNPSATGGNAVYLHLFIDSLAIQPCNPTFVVARNAWIQADVNRFGGANACTLWKAFASRGLGVNAQNYQDDTTVPASCR